MTETVSLASVLVLLAASVAAVALCRVSKLPALVGYLITGLALGPPALGEAPGLLGLSIAAALGKAAIALAVVVLAGPSITRAWLGLAARLRSNELFVLNVLLIILLAAFVTRLAGLSLVLGAFLAGMLIAETEYRFQVEEDIKPYRDVLLGLFFVTVGMALDLHLVVTQAGLVLALFVILVRATFAVVALLVRVFGCP